MVLQHYSLVCVHPLNEVESSVISDFIYLFFTVILCSELSQAIADWYYLLSNFFGQ